MAATSMRKRLSIDVTKNDPGLQVVRLVLSWTESRTAVKHDADLSVGLLEIIEGEEHPKLIDDAYLVRFNNFSTPEGAVKHSGDNRTGAGTDDESVLIDFSLVPPQCSEIAAIGTIDRAEIRKQNWGILQGAIRCEDPRTGEVLAEYRLEDDVADCTAVHFVSFHRDGDNQWRLTAFGQGAKATLAQIIDKWL